jgi:hypothetical protein
MIYALGGNQVFSGNALLLLGNRSGWMLMVLLAISSCAILGAFQQQWPWVLGMLGFLAVYPSMMMSFLYLHAP